ncbi:glycosyltransferase family 2 protein [Aequorivita marina]|uniref:glycosyltransferase family 2 protein n=1 Tax=Aequorivita marina TaxID=3073654 RepID=UPI002875D696|nr:glycosyltransferase family 2 protein [Aequorivita sp. S2608]MDS1298049.1 glycosyltransferase family 2 protein [Aequorivita sp. S2608]
MKLSIIIPIYNGAPFLDKLIQTISAFTITDFECVFIDNNSTDNSVALLNKLLQSAPFDYSILKEEKQGAGFARNTGIKHAKGKYLAFLDCDDIILPEKFEYDFHIFKNHDVDFVFCRAKRFYQDGRVLKHPTTGIKEGINLPPSLGLAWLRNFFALQGTGSLIVKKSVVEKLKGFHTATTGEDAFLFIRMGLLYKGYFYDQTYFHYFRHPDSTISKANKNENGALRRYFELRQHLYNDDIVKDNPIAMHILKEQLQTDILKLHRLGDNINTLKTEKLKRIKLSAILFNPFSLFINRRIPHIKYNPFFQLDRKLLKQRRDKTLKNLRA